MADQADDDGHRPDNPGDKPPGEQGSANQSQPAQSRADSVGQGGGNTPPPSDGLVLPPGPNEDTAVLITDHIRDEVRDALELADFVIKNGTRKPDGRSVPPELIKAIKVTAGKIRLFEDLKEPVYINASEWTRFELAYYSLVGFSSPVTIETLRNTRNTGKGSIKEASSAQKFTWLLWGITIAFALAVIAAAAIGLGGEMAGRDSWTKFARDTAPYVSIIVPYAYGGLGACAFLLRTAHNLIAERSFDVRRKPEYLNRILLGMVSGGAIVLLFAPESEQDTVKISAAALGFIAGYSNDFLFNAIERIVAAVLPRVGLETLKKESASGPSPPLDLPTGGMTLKDLMDRMERANPDDKELYKSLLAKLRDRF